MHHGIGPFLKWKGLTRFGNLSKSGSLPGLIRITKVYSFRLMVKEKLTKCNWKVKWGQIFNMSDLREWRIKLFPLICPLQKYIHLYYSDTEFWNNYMSLDYDRNCSGKSTHVQNGNYWLQKIDHSHDLENDTFDPLLNTTINYMLDKILIPFRFWKLQKFQNFKRSYSKTSIVALEYFVH